MTVRVTGIDARSTLANRLDEMDQDGNGIAKDLNPTQIKALLNMFLEQGQGSFNVEW